MENYIDWTGKTQGNTKLQPPPMTSPSPGVFWHPDHINNSASHQNPYNDDNNDQQRLREQTQDLRQSSDYSSQTYKPNTATMSPSVSPSISNLGESQYNFPQMMGRTDSTRPEGTTPGPTADNTTSHHQTPSQNSYVPPQQAYPNPYSYANASNPYNSNPYNELYPAQQIQTSNYLSPYTAQAPNGVHYTNYEMHHSNGQQPPSNMNAQTHYQHASGPTYMQPQPSYQYQRPEDALNRVHQQTWQPQYQYSHAQNVNPYNQWQPPPIGQTVYYPIENRPVAPKVKPKIERPSSPVRPTVSSYPDRNSHLVGGLTFQEPLAALRYDVSQCLTDYNTSRDLKGCAAALLAIMATCDPIVPALLVDSTTLVSDNAVPEQSPNSKAVADELDPKIKQSALLSVVSVEIKGAMIEEASNNKSIRAKLRTWFVRAHKDNSYVVLKAIISVLDKLTFLSARLLAEVKFGKALLIVSRKCEDKDVKESLVKWVSKAEESLVVERELEVAASKAPALEGEPKKKKAKLLSSSSPPKSAGKSLSPPRTSDVTVKSGERIKPKAVVKKAELVAKTNTAFFKKEVAPVQKPVIAKPGLAAALAGIKARKKTDVVESDSTRNSKPPALPSDAPKSTQQSALPKVLPIAKPAFSALKLVEGLKRTASPSIPVGTETESKRRKTKKSVSWRPDAELEQIRMFESLEPENGEGDVVHTPHEYGNARDLDRKEGALLHGGVLPDREEDFLDWEEPRREITNTRSYFASVLTCLALDFSNKDLMKDRDSRGPKKAGMMPADSKSNEIEEQREQTAFLVIYNHEGEIPWTPSEKDAVSDASSAEPSNPKLIPLPFELRVRSTTPRRSARLLTDQNDWRVRQVLGDLLNEMEPAPADVKVQPIQVMSNTIPEHVTPQAQPDIAAILAGILASQQAALALSPAPDMPPPNSAPITNAPISAPPLPTQSALPFDPKLAEFLAKMAASNGGNLPPPPPRM